MNMYKISAQSKRADSNVSKYINYIPYSYKNSIMQLNLDFLWRPWIARSTLGAAHGIHPLPIPTVKNKSIFSDIFGI